MFAKLPVRRPMTTRSFEVIAATMKARAAARRSGTLTAMVAGMVAISIGASDIQARGYDRSKRSDDAAIGETVKLQAAGDYEPGSIVVVNSERRLYYVLGDGQAIRYPVAIGTMSNQWTGKSFVQSKAKNPAWRPPWSPGRVVPGGPGNPLGARAIYLDWSLYRIHGTNAPGSIGTAASHGCIRMHNRHVKDLYERVHLGAPVFIVESLKSVRESSKR